MLGKTPYETVVPNMESDAIRRVHGAVGESVRTHSDNANITKDGRVLSCRWHNAPLHAPDGSIIGMICIVLEFTELDLELKATREREARARNALEAVPEAILTIDECGRVQTSNLEAQRLFGYAATDLCGVNVGQLLPRSACFLQDKFQPKLGLTEVSGVRSDGGHFVARVSFGSASLASTHVYTAIVQDLTKQKAAERRLHEQRRMEALGRLAGGVAHDFNNLLTVIVGASALLARNLDRPARAQQQLDAIEQASDRASALTTQLLAFSKQQVSSPQAADMNDMVRAALALLERVVGERWPLVARYAQSACPVLIDCGQLEQVLMNLVTNARDAMPEGGTIHVETFRTSSAARSDVPREGYVGLSVTDTGEGLDPEIQAHIFEPFFTTKAANKGTGLGLATVYGITEQAGGHVRVESTPGQGARFEVLLPAASMAGTTPREATESVAVEGSLHGYSALLVEDDEQVCATTAQLLRELGLAVQVAARPVEALDLASKGRVDVLITDLVMPDLDGRALALEIRKSLPSLPILFITGYTRDAVFHRGEFPEQSLLLQKPFSLDALTGALLSLLSREPARGSDLLSV